jgi:tellurite methyltransferase
VSHPPVHEAASRRDWPAYFKRIEGKPPRETLLTAMGLFEKDDRDSDTEISERVAVDLGCGSGRDSAELLGRGWRVHAIDGHPEGIERLHARPECVTHADRLMAEVCDFRRVELPPCDLLNASFSLPFCPPGSFQALWTKIETSIQPGGRFAGQLFGDRDSWAVLEDRTHLLRADALALFDGFLLESFREEDRPGTSTVSPHKHWHVYHIVARKR